MPDTNTISKVCDRLSEVKTRMESILYAADGSKRNYSDEEATEFDKLLSEANNSKQPLPNTRQLITVWKP